MKIITNRKTNFEKKIGDNNEGSTGLDFLKTPIFRLKAAAEQAKRELSSKVQTTITIENLCDGIDFSTSLSRAK